MLASWIHLLAFTIYLGSIVGIWVLGISAISTIKSHEEKTRFLAWSLKIYNPLHIGVLGVLVLSGAYQLTGLKAAYREDFLNQIGLPLAWKLGLSFVLIMLSTHQSMAVGHRFVKRFEAGEAILGEELQSVIRRLGTSSFMIILVAVFTALIGIRLGQ